jgi:hypothetical protein
VLGALYKLNKAVRKGNQHEVFVALDILSSSIGVAAEEDNARLYLRSLQDVLADPERESSDLWLSDAEDALRNASKESKEAQDGKFCRYVLNVQ